MYEIYNKPLVHIYNASLSSGTFLNRIKTAKGIPLHKKRRFKMLKIIYI
jgi:hypothetical protein